MNEYTRVIDHILKTSDLATVSRKKVRKGLETELGKDLNDQKVRFLYPIASGPFVHMFCPWSPLLTASPYRMPLRS